MPEKAPINISANGTSSSTISVTFDPWPSEMLGEGQAIKYIVHMLNENGTWTNASSVSPSNVRMTATLQTLQVDSFYFQSFTFTQIDNGETPVA